MITLSEQPTACRNVLTNPTNMLSYDARRKDLDIVLAPIGVLVRNNRVGIERYRGPSHDLHRRSRGQPMQRRLTRRDLTNDRQAQRVILGSFCYVFSTYGIAIHGRVVESWQIDRGNNVLTNIQVHCVKDVLAEGPQRGHTAEQVLPMSLHGAQLAPIRFWWLREWLEFWRRKLRFFACF